MPAKCYVSPLVIAEPVADRIRPLLPQLANQIAAGEVVERPASVVKELLENSIDAGATQIDIELEAGGARLMRVRDNGCGIHPDDLALAITAHATSKLQQQADLERLLTLGFRGEALASIASVSRLKLVSRRADQTHGWQLQSSGGESPQLTPASHPIGTTVEVADLFFNTPVRRRFLRAERTELHHLQEVVRRQALSCERLALTLQHQGRMLLQIPAGVCERSRQRRLQVLVGKPFLQHALPIDSCAGGMQLSGWIAPPEAARPQADLQYLFVNGRVVRDRLLNHALRHGYGDRLAAGRHPGYLLYLSLDPAQVDVNVHPTKHEVRFREARMVHDFISTTLTQRLEADQQLALTLAPSSARAEPAAPTLAEPAARSLAEPTVATSRIAEPPIKIEGEQRRVGYTQIFPNTCAPLPPLVTSTPVQQAVAAPAPRAATTAATPPHQEAGHWLAIADYLLVSDDHLAAPLWLVAITPAWQWLLHHRFSRQRQQQQPLAMTPLLVPHQVAVEAAWIERARQLAPTLQQIGVELAVAAKGRVVLRAVPYQLRGVDANQIVSALLGTATTGAAEAQELQLLERLCQQARPTSPLAAEQRSMLLAALPQLQQQPHLCRRIEAADLANWLSVAT